MNKKFLPFVLLFFFLVILIKYGPLLLLLPDQARRDRIAYYQLQFENQRTAYLDAQPSRVLPFLSFNEISPKIEKKWNEPFSLIGSENYNRNRFYIIIKRHPDFFQKVDFITLTNNSDKILSVKYTFDLRKLSFDNQKEKNDFEKDFLKFTQEQLRILFPENPEILSTLEIWLQENTSNLLINSQSSLLVANILFTYEYRSTEIGIERALYLQKSEFLPPQ